MGASTALAVIDAGPLIHLSELGVLPLLRVFGELHVPQAVWAETAGQERVAAADLLDLDILIQHSVASSDVDHFVQAHSLSALHVGEQACLFLCDRLNVTQLVTDDLAARDAAKRLRVTPIGSLGVVIRAYRLGLISLEQAEKVLMDLYSVSSLFVTRDIVQLAIDRLRRER
jgi:predicted nucleic acid-binding protein